MNAVEAAALIAAVFWAVLVSVGVFVLFRLGRLMGETSGLLLTSVSAVTCCCSGPRWAVDGAQAAVDRQALQLDRSESVTASMDELGAGMAELAGEVTALAWLGRTIAACPVGRVGALVDGVRHAGSACALRTAAAARPAVRCPAASWTAASWSGRVGRSDPPRVSG